MKNKVRKFLNIAAKVARLKDDNRNFFIGAVAIRADDVTVYAYNGAPKYPTPEHHCEARLCRKLDKGAIVYVARTTNNGDWAMSKPCDNCTRILRRSKVKKVFYTIAPNEYGCITF
jgi:deoxycytidylate deaminase